MELKFEIEQFSFAVSRRIRKKDVKMLKFAVHNLGTNVCMRTFDMTADIYLGGIILEHSEFQTPKGEPLKMISTTLNESEENLFSLKYLSANKKAPDFAAMYDSILQNIKVDFREIDIILHQEAILSIMDFSNTLLSSMQSLSEKPAAVTPAPCSDKEPTKKKSHSEEKVKPKLVSKRKVDSQLIDIQLNAALESIRLIICNKKYEITDISIKGMNASVTVQKSKTSLSASLKDMIVYDPSPRALYPQIINTVAGEVLDVKLIIFNDATDDENYINMSAVDMSICVSFGRMKIVFLNKFVSSLLMFLDHFQAAKDRVAEASAAAAEVAKQSMEEVYEKSTRISLDIVIQAPVIITPQNSLSSNAIVVDLGILKIMNHFMLGEKKNELGIPAIFEEMVLDLQNLQLFRALVKPDTGDIIAQCLILEPISFTLEVIRNHSFSWHTEQPEMKISGKLAAVKVTLSQDDYNTVMKVLSENLAEIPEDSQPKTSVSATPNSVETKTTSQTVSAVPEKRISVCDVVPCKVHKRFNFLFILDSVVLTLCHGETQLTEGLSEREKSCSIAEVQIKVLEAHAVMMSDSSMLAEVFLKDVILEDTRKTRKSGVTRLMERSATEGLENMINIEFKQSKTGEKTLQTTVSSFSLIFCLDYIMMLGEFFSGSSSSTQPQTAQVSSESNAVKPKQSVVSTAPQSLSETSLSNASGVTVIYLKVEQPDIVLIENIEDVNSSAIFLNNEIDLKMTIAGTSQAISGSINNLTFYTACFNAEKRRETSAKILSPCHIDVQCNFREHSQHLDVIFRDLIFHISPGTVTLITSILSSIVSEPVKVEDKATLEEKDYSDLWTVKSLKDEKFWFLETVAVEEAICMEKEDSLQDIVVQPEIHQQLLFTMRKVVITLEAGVGTRTVPMLLMESSFQADIRDWASNLYIGSSFSLEMSYYNEKIAVWEPLIEPIETSRGHRSWELIMELSKSVDALDLSPDEDEPDEVVFAPPQMSIQVAAQDVLELTVSKTSMDVLTNLGQAFQEAVNKAVGKEPVEPHAPYHVNNYLGIPINIILSNGIFQILNEDKSYNCVKLESGCPSLHLTYSLPKTGPSSRLSVLKKQDFKEETYFNIMIAQEDMTVERRISVACTDKRFFQLPRVTYPGNRWGFVISILSLYGSKFVTFHSILKVHNHFSVPVDIYYMKPSLNEVEWCACAEPNKTEYIPLHAVYTSTSELFFKPKN
ncbi:Vacuolar protein sorting-associated protein 13C, partial [Stegodyphus mimosarum]